MIPCGVDGIALSARIWIGLIHLFNRCLVSIYYVPRSPLHVVDIQFIIIHSQLLIEKRLLNTYSMFVPKDGKLFRC